MRECRSAEILLKCFPQAGLGQYPVMVFAGELPDAAGWVHMAFSCLSGAGRVSLPSPDSPWAANSSTSPSVSMRMAATGVAI